MTKEEGGTDGGEKKRLDSYGSSLRGGGPPPKGTRSLETLHQTWDWSATTTITVGPDCGFIV